MMGSKDDDDTKKSGDDAKKSVDHHQQPLPPHYQGYPPPPYQGYGQPPPNYLMYPNNYPPPPGYYPPPQHYMPVGPERSQGYTFIRLLLIMLIMFFIGFSVMSLATWLIFGSDIPYIHVDSLTMPVSNITNSTLVAAKWDASFTVKNPNNKLQIYFENIETNLLYKDYSLATSSVDPFEVPTHEKKSITSTFEEKDYDKNVAAGLFVKELSEHKDSTVVNFDIAMSTTAVYRKPSSEWKRKVGLRVLCLDLEVVFSSGISSKGTWRGENLKDCYVWTY